MTISRYFAYATALAASIASPAAQAAECVTRSEISGMMGFAIPSLLASVRDHCAAHVAADGFFATGSAAMIGAYTERKAAAWPAAKAAFVKFAASEGAEGSNLMLSLPDEALQPLVEAFLPALVTQGVKVGDCANVEDILSALAPLPPENTARLFGSIMAMTSSGGDGGADKRNLPVCRN